MQFAFIFVRLPVSREEVVKVNDLLNSPGVKKGLIAQILLDITDKGIHIGI